MNVEKYENDEKRLKPFNKILKMIVPSRNHY